MSRRRRFARRLGFILVCVLVLAVPTLVVWRDEVRAQWQTTVVLADLLHRDRLNVVAHALTREPSEREVKLGGVPATEWRPAGPGDHSAIMLLTGVDHSGRTHPDVRRASRALARAGYVVFAPDTPGLREGRVGTDTVTATAHVVQAAVKRDEVRGGKVSLVSLSAGASLALLVAAQKDTRDKVRSVLAIAPFADMRTVAMLATTGLYRTRDGILLPYDTSPKLRDVFETSVAAAIDQGAGLLKLDSNTHTVSSAPSPEALALAKAALDNRDPEKFDALYDALPANVRDELDDLSPLTHAKDVTAHVEIATSPSDDYFPVEESRKLVAALPDATLTVTPLLDHAIPSAKGQALEDVGVFDLLAVRALAAAGA